MLSRPGSINTMIQADRDIKPPVKYPTHFLVLFKRKFVSKEKSRHDAEKFAINKFQLDKKLADKLCRSLVVKIPRQGLLEIVWCDCTDDKHIDEL